MPRDPLNAVALAYEGLCTFEFGIAVELFGLPRPEHAPWYRLRVAALCPGPHQAVGGITISAPYTLRALDTAGTIVIPGWRTSNGPAAPQLLRKLRRAHEQGARILSVCSGAFLLAETGLLEGKRATTHWLYAEDLARRYPGVRVDPEVLYVDEGNLLTSAGSAAGIDMGLHLIRRDHGAAVANAVARRLVVPPHREGGQKQFIDTPLDPAGASDPDERALARLLDQLRGTLAAEHTVESMARSAHMSPRTLARRFKAGSGRPLP